MKLKQVLLGALAAWCSIVPAWSAKLGDPAKPLSIREWIKGKPVDVTDRKNIYVVEFWATWCGPCKVTIPNLTEMQRRFKEKGVVIVSISSGEAPETVRPFVEQMGTNMEYAVALDSEDNKSNGEYMAAYGAQGIPHAFIVGRDGKVNWVGHPMAGLDVALQEMIDGKYDIKAAIERDRPRTLWSDYFEMAAKDDPAATTTGRQLINFINDPNGLFMLSFNMASSPAIKKKDFALAGEAVSKAEKLTSPQEPAVTAIRGIIRFESGEHDAGLAMIRKAVDMTPHPQIKATFANWSQTYQTRLAALKTQSTDAPAPTSTPAPTQTPGPTPIGPTPTPTPASTPTPPGEKK